MVGEKDLAGGFGTLILFSHILGMSSSQLTFIFFQGAETTNQSLSDDVVKFDYKPTTFDSNDEDYFS